MSSGTAPDIGSTERMYDLLVKAADNTPVEGNQDGSYLTMKSNNGLVFGVAGMLTGFAGVFCDQGELSSNSYMSTGSRLVGYWQRVRRSIKYTTFLEKSFP